MLRRFGKFWLSLADKVTTGIYNFVSLILKIILSRLAFVLSLHAADKRQSFVHIRFNSTLRLISGISSDLQKSLQYFNGTAIVSFSRIPLAAFGAGWATIVSNNLALYLKDLKLLVFPILLLKLFAPSL